MPTADLTRTLAAARDHLLARRAEAGHWQGRLSSSALSTATAVWALDVVRRERGPGPFGRLIQPGLDWLARHQGHDGGWGDTVLSSSNLSTTLLAWSALAASDGRDDHRRAADRAEAYVRARTGGGTAAGIAEAVAALYGEDRTFSAPILLMAAQAGRLGPAPAAWRRVAALPFELAALPPGWWKHLRLPVVSYALPALIAIGQARYRQAPPRNPAARLLRRATVGKTLQRLAAIQPESGGFLEAPPLTSFVAMALASAGQAHHPTVARCVAFLARSVREDGSWPIDTNLATWVTTLSVNALAGGRGSTHAALPAEDRRRVVDWLLGQQHTRVHPYTQADPGGWAWTDLPGGVPDADDTAGAVLALAHLAPDAERAAAAAAEGIGWLLGLQNRDGGIPTFCRGWGRLPFDRSGPDLTAHAVAAWSAWRDRLPARLARKVAPATGRALRYLARTQRGDGAWVPLWFGNEHLPDQTNPTYGTARVVSALAGLVRSGGPGDAASPPVASLAARGAAWLLAAQRVGGGWGGEPTAPPSIEETALATEALARWAPVAEGRSETRGDTPPADPPATRAADAARRGARYLAGATGGGTTFAPAPIGFYFARLGYFERLYPVIFTVGALERVRWMESEPRP